MAIRRKVAHDKKTRESIQTTQLIKRLMNHIDSKIELSTSQVRSIEILLKKTLPDLQAITVEGGENPIQYAQVGYEPMGDAEWLAKHGRGDHNPAPSTH
jgi:hypothetical protein